ncbi:hypothetical protein HanPSC8_Chr14g0614861 [Helianthus annuus]|nr:hypothetical protein HanPSC8_Chr14g0614861 [Helianthus annuus]
MLMLNDLRELGIEVWQQRIPKQVFLSLSVTLGQVVEHAVSTLPLSICIVAVPHPSKTNILFSENQNGLLLRSTPIISLLFRTGSRQSEIFGVLTLSNWPSTPNSSRWLSAGRYGLEDLQSTMYHLLTEQSAPIPKGSDIGITERFLNASSSENLPSSYGEDRATKKAEPVQPPSSSSNPVMLMLYDLR